MAAFRRTCSIIRCRYQSFRCIAGLLPFSLSFRSDGQRVARILPPLGKTWLLPVARISNGDDEVPELNEASFHDYIRTNGKVFVMFYDPFCPVCQRSTIAFQNFYDKMKNSIAFGAVDAPKNPDLAIAEHVNAFPTFRLYVCNGKCTHKSHEGGLSEDEMKSFVKCSTCSGNRSVEVVKRCLEVVHRDVRRWWPASGLNVARGICSSAVGLSPHDAKTIKLGKSEIKLNNRVMEVNSRNFEVKIKTFNSALVYFYASWCSHCSESLTEFMKAAEIVEHTVGVLAICDAERNLEIVDKYGITKIPTLKYFRKDTFVADYIGEIKKDLLLKFMSEPPEDEELVGGSEKVGEVSAVVKKRKLWEGNDGSELIIEVTDNNVDQVLSQNESILLLFYTCWNKTCLDLRSDYIDVAKAIENPEIVVCACNCEENVAVADRFLVGRFPALKYLRKGKPVREYTGNFQVESILEFLKDPSKLQIVAQKEAPKEDQTGDTDVPEYWKAVEGGNLLLHLTDGNYKVVIEQTPSLLVMFYVPWCKSCIPLKKEFGRAAINVPKDVGTLGACNAERNIEMADVFLIQRLPTVKYFKSGKFLTDYIGKRKAEDLISFMANPVTGAMPPPAVAQ